MNKENHLEYLSIELFEKGNYKVINDFFAEDYIAHDGTKIHTGHQFIKQFIIKLRKTIPNIKMLKFELLSQTEETITWQRTFSGTHQANLFGIPASIKKVKWNEIVVTRFKGAYIAEEWVVSNLAFQLMLKQTK